jgi:hypothetical protein
MVNSLTWRESRLPPAISNECSETGHVKAKCPNRARNVKCHKVSKNEFNFDPTSSNKVSLAAQRVADNLNSTYAALGPECDAEEVVDVGGDAGNEDNIPSFGTFGTSEDKVLRGPTVSTDDVLTHS